MAAKEPNVTRRVGEVGGCPASAGDVGGRRSALRAVNAGLVEIVGAAAPDPVAEETAIGRGGAGNEFPNVVEEFGIKAGGSIALAAKHPEVVGSVGPGYAAPARARLVYQGVGNAQRTVNATCVDDFQ